MLKSKARRRLALKTSALTFAGTLGLLAGSILGLTSPVSADTRMAAPALTYNCTAGGFNQNPAVPVTVTSPASMEPGKTGQVTWSVPTGLTAGRALAVGTKVEIKNTLTLTGGATPATLVGSYSQTLTTDLAIGGQFVPTSQTVAATVTAPSTAGTVTLSPGTVQTAKTLQIIVTPPNATAITTDCTLTAANPATASITVQAGTGTGTNTDIVDYQCKLGTSTTEDIQIKVELTMPTTAKVGEQFTIGWKGTYESGQELYAPDTGTMPAAKIFAYAALTGITNLTSATGEGVTGAVTAGQIITLPTNLINLKSTANAAGTVTVKPGKINFGSDTATGNSPSYQCTVQNEAALKALTFTVAAGNGTGTPTPTPTPTNTTPKPTRTVTAVVTKTPVGGNGKVTKTPKGGAETGGGGDMGPDGRMFVLTGSALVLVAGVGGLYMRRRTIPRG